MTTAQYGAWVVPWVESEKGWGQKIIEYCVYSTRDEALANSSLKVKDMRAEEAKEGYVLGRVPDTYWYPSEPMFQPIGSVTAERLQRGWFKVDTLKELEA